MTDYDHAAEARKHLADAVTDPQATPWDLTDEHEQWHIDATLSVAQVHATLALVEQQRIANLIAATRLIPEGERPGVDSWGAASDSALHSRLADEDTWIALLGTDGYERERKQHD